MTEHEIKNLPQETLLDLKNKILVEINRRESLINIPQDIARVAATYKSLGGNTTELINTINSLPESEE